MLKIQLTLLLLVGAAYCAISQSPREIELDNDPFDFTDPIKLIFILILPVLTIVLGWFYLKRKGNSKRIK